VIFRSQNGAASKKVQEGLTGKVSVTPLPVCDASPYSDTGVSQSTGSDCANVIQSALYYTPARQHYCSQLVNWTENSGGQIATTTLAETLPTRHDHAVGALYRSGLCAPIRNAFEITQRTSDSMTPCRYATCLTHAITATHQPLTTSSL
jgi:hypothetical protein